MSHLLIQYRTSYGAHRHLDNDSDLDPPIDSAEGTVLQALRYDDEGEFTITAVQQKETEGNVSLYQTEQKTDPTERVKIELKREAHKTYLLRGLNYLGSHYQGLDASQPWLAYWILNSLDLLGCLTDPQGPEDPKAPDSTTLQGAITFLASCVDSRCGGYAGGPGQLAHLAPTYAAVNALCAIGTEAAYHSINREALYQFLVSMKCESGGFTMHENGEMDIRATYCALSVARLTNLLDERLLWNVDKFLESCQTFEGGIAAEPGNEAHGGYAFCGLAAGIITDTAHVLDMDRLIYWAVCRQMQYEGGFQGRTNKLVDGCYSFWQGALFPLFDRLLSTTGSSTDDMRVEARPGATLFEETLQEASWLCNQRALQDYILLCCQPLGGGLCDKPPKGSDYYHTCYTLNGLSIAQHNRAGMDPTVVGKSSNLLLPIDPLHGIRTTKSAQALAYFAKLPSLSPF